MKYCFLFIVALSTVAFSCKTVKKTQVVIQQAITKKDTSQTIVIKETPRVDSAAIVKDIMSKVVRRKIDFNTFNATIKVTYEGPEKSDNFKVYVGMKKDSIILMKVVGTFLGIPGVGLEAKVNKDSITVYFHQGEKYVMTRPISYLKEVIEIPFDFSTIQDLIIGNPVFIDSNVVSYRAGVNQLSVLMIGDLFKHLLTMDNSDFKALHSKLDDVDIQRNRTGDITFGSYERMGPYQFATWRSISIAEKSKLNLYLDFKEYALNEPLKYNFDVPKKTKRK
ncbi:MAG: hypothetical protein JWQ30_297 [Sediminibacterium sp.]|nr:hypothetical protein [Sediminibacterium sp.]